MNLGPRPLYPDADSPAHVQDIITGVRDPSLYNTACQGKRIFHDRYSPFPFDHSYFELARVSLSMTQQPQEQADWLYVD